MNIDHLSLDELLHFASNSDNYLAFKIVTEFYHACPNKSIEDVLEENETLKETVQDLTKEIETLNDIISKYNITIKNIEDQVTYEIKSLYHMPTTFVAIKQRKNFRFVVKEQPQEYWKGYNTRH